MFNQPNHELRVTKLSHYILGGCLSTLSNQGHTLLYYKHVI